jgi:diaminopimelate epimerase
MEINFVKMTGAGNDFVLIDNRSNSWSVDWPAFAPLVCHRRYGIGADGLLILEASKSVDFAMKYYNADGSYGGMCGNGGRCISRFYMENMHKKETAFEALDYVYTARLEGETVSLKMKNPSRIKLNELLTIKDQSFRTHFIDTGSPHVVIYVKDLPTRLDEEIKRIGIVNLGRGVRNHFRYAPDGTNVNFLEIENANTIRMRTYERGVENETLACGTGSVASAIISALVMDMPSPIRVHVRSGEKLVVSFDRNGSDISNVQLSGSASFVFKGTVQFDPERESIKS